LSNILNFLFPVRCPGCRKVMENPDGLIHPECRKRFKLINEPRCFKCGRHMDDPEATLCTECNGKKHTYSYGLALFEYDETARLAMIDFKKNGWRSNGDFFAEEAGRILGSTVRSMNPEVLIPVPITRRRRNERGFNQSEYLADRIGKILRIPVDKEVLSRKGRGIQQKQLSGRERAGNAADSFICKENPYKRICLIDDVYTTGSTLDGCTRVLRDSGAEDVGFLVIFSGDMY